MSSDKVVELRPNQNVARHDGNIVASGSYYRHGNGNGGGGDMLDRVKALEDKVSTMAIDVAVLKETVATKETLHKELNAQTWKIIAALVIAVAMAVLTKYFIK